MDRNQRRHHARYGLRATRRGLLGGGLAVAAAGLLPATAAAAAPSTRVRIPLPAPTGRHRIGTTALHLIDHSRPDPWVPSAPYRELMISIWYPARPSLHPLAAYMAPGAAAHYDQVLAGPIEKYRLGVVDWAGTPTHARLHAPAVDGDGGRPVVLYGPGGGNPRTLGTALVEELAGHGYVVVAIDHTYEASEVEFPDGRVALDRRPDDHTRGQCAAVRVADTRFVLDTLAALAAGHSPDAGGRPLPPGLGGSLDLTRIGMVGYSAGGFAAAETMLVDHRIAAGVNLDGRLLDDDDPVVLGRVAELGLDRPFLQVATPGHTRDSDVSWAAFWTHQRGWRRELRLERSTHLSLCDLQVAIPALADVMGLTRDEITAAVGSVDPVRSVTAQRAYLTAFFDRHLRGRPGTLLDRPSPRFPEITFVP
jgi:predicted dienelactone hydrolase